MDAYYASVEQRDHPEWRGKPIAVGGGGRRGVITTASYEARKFGVRSAMPGFKAKALCPQLIFTPIRMDVYAKLSKQIREIFRKYTDIIEPLSLDEAYLDVTHNKVGEPIATELAYKIQQDIYHETQLTCSAGVSYCKFIAKLASDIKKPNGVTVVKPNRAVVFLEELPIEKFFGVGKVTARKMKARGIHFGRDLKTLSKLELAQQYGKMGRFYFDVVRGIDDRPVKSDRIRKSLGVETTMGEDLNQLDQVLKRLDSIVDLFYERLKKANNFGRTITLKVKTAQFQQFTRSHSANLYIRNKEEIKYIAQKLLVDNFETFKTIRLMGLTASNLEKEKEVGHNQQLTIEF